MNNTNFEYAKEFARKIYSILLSGDEGKDPENCEISQMVNRYNCFEISVSAMYESPVISLPMLKQLSELFGTDKIDMDNFGHGGCETCDYGSEYGHTIQIYDATKNIEEMHQVIDLNSIKRVVD